VIPVYLGEQVLKAMHRKEKGMRDKLASRTPLLFSQPMSSAGNVEHVKCVLISRKPRLVEWREAGAAE
jgi:hypothetical protein